MGTIAKFNHTEVQILTLLRRGSTHVRSLRRELDDNGAVSSHLKHLEGLGLVRRRNSKGRVVNGLTAKGVQVAKVLKMFQT